MSKKAKLSIYSASAGSGKTYILTINFIKLLVAEPQNYEHIMAVTFTNKATAEMKERIIEYLYLLAFDPLKNIQLSEKERQHKSNFRQNLVEKLQSEGVEKSENEIYTSCRKALLLILNDYSQFNISTIDSFVQKVIRAFAYEAQLPATFGIELDTDILLDNATSEMMSTLSTDEKLREWIENYVIEKMDDKGTWSIETEIKSLGKELFNGTNCNGIQVASTESGKSLSEYKKELKEITIFFEKKLKEYSEEFKAYVLKENIKNEDYLHPKRYGNGWYLIQFLEKNDDLIASYLLEKASKIKDICEDKELIANANQHQKIHDIFSKIYEHIEQNKYDYYTAKAILKNINTIGILINIDNEIRKLSRQEGKYPLNDCSTLLSKLIDQSYVPFIYEKIGTNIYNMMIDEFQDTSTVQWQNFKPIVKECIDRNNDSLLVGDVKQAIYRWRGSDWRMLNNGVSNDNDFRNAVEFQSLNNNWRSLPNVIAFNNFIFSEIHKCVAESVGAVTGQKEDIYEKIFSDSKQNYPKRKDSKGNLIEPKEKGYVKVRLTYKKANAKNKSEENSEENAEDKGLFDESDFINQIEKLLSKGYNYRDISVLVRDRDDAEKVIQVLIKNNIPIISSDSLLVCNSEAVKMIIAYMQFIVNPQNKTALAQILISQNKCDLISTLSQDKEQIRSNLVKLRGLGLIEMTQAIIEMLPKDVVKSQFIFVEAFCDIVRDFVASKHVNLSDLLEHIERNINKFTVNAPENQDAITIMTIHKSKGLQFKVVLIPFADWTINKYSNGLLTSYIWAKIDKPPFNYISPVPMSYNKEMENTYARDYYYAENRLNAVDSLNLLYVAQTRAKEVLMMWGELPQKKDSEFEIEYNSKTKISQYLAAVLNQNSLENMESEIKDEDENIIEYTIGEIPNHIGLQKEIELVKTFESEQYEMHKWFDRIAIHRESEKDRFLSEHDMINYGNVMHAIMERIITIDDVEKSVNISLLDGEIDAQRASILKQELKSRLQSESISHWFDGSIPNVYTEDVILTSAAENRPDRIMIDNNKKVIVVDYKFGDLQPQKYDKQVSEYISLLRKAGYTDVEGYLWYYQKNEIVHIE